MRARPCATCTGSRAVRTVSRCLSHWDSVESVRRGRLHLHVRAERGLTRSGEEAQRGTPGTAIAFGGANWEGEMGQELHRSFPFVDIVCSGEADESFPARAVEPLGTPQSGLAHPGYRLPGWRETVSTGPRPRHKARRLPFPDFDDFFRAVPRPRVGRARSRSCSRQPVDAGGAQARTARSAASTEP